MIHQISLADCLSPMSPPEQVLTVNALDDVAFVRICKVQQGSRSEKHTEVAEVSVSLASLLEAVQLLANDQEREHLRPRENARGDRETRLAGARLTAAPAGPSSAIGALTTHLRYTPLPKPPAGPEPQSEPS